MQVTIGISLLLLSAVLHAAWNFLAKRSKTHSKEFFLIANTIGIILCLPIILFTPFQQLHLPRDIILYLVFSGLFESFYFTTLAKCYKHGDLSITYPIARTFPIIFVTLFSVVHDHLHLPLYFILGGCIVVTGCLILPMHHFRDFTLKRYAHPSTLFAFLTSLSCTGYLISDSKALLLLHHHNKDIHFVVIAIFYALIRSIAISLLLSVPSWIQKSSRNNLRFVLRESFHPVLITGICMTITYTLVLIAMTLMSNVSYVTLVRQLSIPLSALLGIYISKEPNRLTKWVGIVMMFCGVVMASL